MHRTFDLEEAVALLAATPGTLRQLLQDLPSGWDRAVEGPDSWSPYDVVGHLAHGERTDWIVRLRTILEHGESRPFAPFDRTAMLRDDPHRSLGELLDDFTALRRQNLETLRGLDLGPAELDRTGRHPDFGVVTARQLLATWVVHDFNHVSQIARTLAKQYRSSVGPWAAYLPLLADREPAR